jgi:hypothetical protein
LIFEWTLDRIILSMANCIKTLGAYYGRPTWFEKVFPSSRPWSVYAVHDYFKHAGGRDIFLLDWRQVLSYDVSFLNIRIVVNSVINLVNKNLPRTALRICMFHFNYNFTIIVPNAFNYLKNVTTWEQCSVEL